MSHNTDNPTGRIDREQLTTIKRLGILALALAIAIVGITAASGAAAAHPDHEHVEDPGNELGDDDSEQYMGDEYEYGVEDHGWLPANGVQEGAYSDGYGGYYNG